MTAALETPVPTAMDSERAVLAAAVYSPAAYVEATRLISDDEWYTPMHAEIWQAMHAVFGRLGAVDAIALSDELRNTGSRALSILPNVLTAEPVVSVSYHCERISEASNLRALARAGTNLVQRARLGNEPVGLAEDVILELRTIQRMGAPIAETEIDFLDLVARPVDEENFVIPNLLAPMNRLILTGPEGWGKAIKTDTSVPTPKGWITMGELSAGDEVFSPTGEPVRVIATSDVLHGRACYRVSFSDGATIVADGQHQWLTETLRAREGEAQARRRNPVTKPHGSDQRHLRRHFPAVITTVGIRDTLHARGGHTLNHAIETARPLRYPRQFLPINPYLLGFWLGDGTTKSGVLTVNRRDLADLEARLDGVNAAHHRVPSSERPGCVDVRIDGLTSSLRHAGLLGDKHVPQAYLQACVEQRLELLRGLMDSDGWVTGLGHGHGRGGGTNACELTFTRKRLAEGAVELLHSLGVKLAISESDAVLNGRTVGRRWRIRFQSQFNPFHVAHKAERWSPLRTRRAALRYITAVEPVESVPVRCIQVAAQDGLFVVGRECIPTHNSGLVRQLATCTAAGVHPFEPKAAITPQRVLVIDAENPAEINTTEYQRLHRRLRDLGKMPERGMLRVEESGPMNLLDGRQAARLYALVERLQPRLITIGPIYQLHEENPNDEGPARKLSAVLDRLRAISQAALIIEAHSPHSDGPGGHMLRPFGASLWKRWPDFGYCLLPENMPADASEDERFIAAQMRESKLASWRGARAKRDFPRKLGVGATLPWEVYG